MKFDIITLCFNKKNSWIFWKFGMQLHKKYGRKFFTFLQISLWVQSFWNFPQKNLELRFFLLSLTSKILLSDIIVDVLLPLFPVQVPEFRVLWVEGLIEEVGDGAAHGGRPAGGWATPIKYLSTNETKIYGLIVYYGPFSFTFFSL